MITPKRKDPWREAYMKSLEQIIIRADCWRRVFSYSRKEECDELVNIMHRNIPRPKKSERKKGSKV